MRKIALITPWPNERTGIADYAYDLAIGLAKEQVKMDVFTTSPDRPSVPKNVQVHSLDQFQSGSDFDSVVYQMGNCSDFHAEMLAVLFENPGIVHLHDLTLHHLIAYFLYRGTTKEYYRVLQYWYGPATMQKVKAHNELAQAGFWDSEKVASVPFFDPVLQFAKGCIVHSGYAQNAIANRFPGLQSCVLPQVYRDMQPSQGRAPNSSIQVGIFGIVQPHKHVDLVLECLADCRAQELDLHLHIGGALDRGCERLLDTVDSLGLNGSVTYHGRLSTDGFVELMRRVDVCVSLRYPTMGETSAVVSRAMQLGIPTIVNDVGWYAELPDCVKKLPTDRGAMRSGLIDCFHGCVTDPAEFQAWRSQCLQLASNSFSFEVVVQQYLEALSSLSGTGVFGTASLQVPPANPNHKIQRLAA